MNDNEILNVLQDLWVYSKSVKYTEKEIRTALDYAMKTIARVHTIIGLESSVETLGKCPASAEILEFESDQIREILTPEFEIIAYFKNGQCFDTTGADAVMNDNEIKVKDVNGNITAIINRSEALAITCNKIREAAQ